MLAGVAGSRTEQTPKEATGGGRTGVRPRQVPSRTPGVSRRSVTISLTSMVPKRCELSPCQASPGRSLALTPLNGYRMESQERGGEPGARQAHLSGTKGQRGGPDIITRCDLILPTRLCGDGGGPHQGPAVSAWVCFPESRPAGLGLLGLSPGTGWRRCRLPRSEEKEARGASCAWKVSPGTLGRSVPALPAAPRLRGAGSPGRGRVCSPSLQKDASPPSVPSPLSLPQPPVPCSASSARSGDLARGTQAARHGTRHVAPCPKSLHT